MEKNNTLRETPKTEEKKQKQTNKKSRKVMENGKRTQGKKENNTSRQRYYPERKTRLESQLLRNQLAISPK